MAFQEYQKAAIRTEVFGGKKVPVDSPAFFAQLLGLVGETGEVAEKFKKIYRDKGGKFNATDKTVMTKELGDILWYISVMCTYLGIDLNDLAEQNIAKLKGRATLKGSGDNR